MALQHTHPAALPAASVNFEEFNHLQHVAHEVYFGSFIEVQDQHVLGYFSVGRLVF